MVYGENVSSFGLKVLKKMESGRKAKLSTDGRLSIGAITAPKSLVANLKKQDLLEFTDTGHVSITDAGLMYLRRAKSLRGLASKRNADQENVFRSQHARFVIIEEKVGNKSGRVRKNIGDSPLGWLFRRKDKNGKPHISETQFDAGEKLARDYEYAGLLSRTVGYYDGVPISGKKYYSGNGDDQTLTQVAAKQRVEAALAYVGPGLSDVLVRVCCYHEGLELAEKNLAWPTRSAKLVLKIALDRLVDFYKPGK